MKRNRKRIDRTTTASIARKNRAAAPKAAAAGGSGQYSTIIERHAASNGVPVSLAKAVIMIESGFQPNQVGSAGEIGLMQIKPSTARMMGYSGSIKGLYDPDTNIKYGMKYLAMARNLGGGTTCGTILKYNAGHGAKRMNPISAAYCGKVKVQLAALGAPA
ncbi:soluble lytic murein transglycosylase-like protein [Mesorhizobium robiniae]|uniref:Soluble lytic murein transglycosylase-like protein n=1 Tax=Mesorhizobium robiniae TaxID=559315 RepID=A0ABV2GHQ9_9HYPH